MMKSNTKVFRDPIYELISFDKDKERVILDIIDTFEFQRLRRIRQLGFSHYTYYTATHDRFSHSLGVSYIIGVLFDNLNIEDDIINVTLEVEPEKYEYVDFTKEELRLLLKLGGLLHDIGHGPFSHIFEDIMKISHEKLSGFIIRNNSNISDIIDSIDYSNNLKKYSKIFILNLINGKIQPIWIKELISSQLDADRIDYLRRDAYMCGVSYATFDLKWLFQNLEKDKINAERGREGILINANKGIHAIESFIISRYHMYEQVYFHKTSRCFELIFQKLFKRLLSLYNDKISTNYFLNESFYNLFTKKDLNSFLDLDDFSLFTHIKHWYKITDDIILKDLCESLIYRKPYKMILEEESGFKKIYDKQEELRKKIGEEELEYYFLIDDYLTIPYKDNFLLGESNPESAEHIWLKIGNKQVELSQKSPIISSLKNKEFKKYRAFLHRKYI